MNKLRGREEKTLMKDAHLRGFFHHPKKPLKYFNNPQNSIKPTSFLLQKKKQFYKPKTHSFLDSLKKYNLSFQLPKK